MQDLVDCPLSHHFISSGDFRQPRSKSFNRGHANNAVAVRNLKTIPIASKLSSLNFNSPVRAERSFVICYPNVVIKALCGNLDICLSYHACEHLLSVVKFCSGDFGRELRPKVRDEQ